MADGLTSTAGMDRQEAYDAMETDLAALLDGDPACDLVARLSTVACVLHRGLGALWTGFYRRGADDVLRVGPYQGSLGCLSIAPGRGVCGRAAADARTVVVPDVTAFPGHIACDARSRAEIVVPVVDDTGLVQAVLDIDADTLAAFGEVDCERLERIVARFVAPYVSPPRA